MRQETINIYKFDELCDSAKEAAIDHCRYWQVDDEWWQSTYDDAENIGLEIMGFDTDRGNYCDLKLKMNWNYDQIAEAILNNHGEHCDTYKIASKFIDEYKKLSDSYDLDHIQELQHDFIHDLSSKYLSMLRIDYDYLISDEAVIEMIEANEYEFTENGEFYS